MAGVREVLFDEHCVVAECSPCFGAAALVLPLEFCGIGNNPHAPATPTGDSLQHDGTTGAKVAHEGGSVRRGDRTTAAREDRDAAVARERACTCLIAERAQRRRCWANKCETVRIALFGERGVF